MSDSTNDVDRRLTQLSSPRKLAFLAACCQRILPNYAAFEEEHGWGDLQTLQEAVNLVWEKAAGRDVAASKLSQLRASCDRAIPHSDDFDSDLVSAAIDVGVAIYETLGVALGLEDARPTDVVQACRETIEMRLQLDRDMSSDEIRNHPAMVAEVERQSRDLTSIEAADDVDRDFLEAFRRSATS